MHGLIVGGLIAFFQLGGTWVSTWGLSPQPADWPREFAKAGVYFLAGVGGGALYSCLTRHSVAPRIGERARAGAIAGAAVGFIAAAVGAVFARWSNIGTTLLAMVALVAVISGFGALVAAVRWFPGLPPSR